MAMDKKQIGAANVPMYYTLSGKRTLALRVEILLRDEVDPEVLQSALEKTLERYPNWQQTLVSDGKNVFYRKNDAIPKIKEDDGSTCRFCTEETQGYLFRVIYTKNSFTVDMHHGITDGKGNNEFFKTLLFYYFTGMGYSVETEGRVKLNGDTPDATEMEQTFEKYGNSETTPSFILENTAAFRLPEEEMDQSKAVCRRYAITCSIKELLDYSKKNGASVAPVLADMVSRTIEGLYEVGDAEVIGYMTANLRTHYHSESLENFSMSFPIPYYHSFRDMPLADRAKELKSLMTRQLQLENFDVRIAQHTDAAKAMYDMEGSFIEKTRIFEEKMKAKKSVYTFCLTYVGKIDLPDSFLPYVTGINTFMPSFIVPFTISGTSLRDVLTLVVMQDFESDTLVKALTKTFCDEGINAELHDNGYFHGSILLPEDIPVEQD